MVSGRGSHLSILANEQYLNLEKTVRYPGGELVPTALQHPSGNIGPPPTALSALPTIRHTSFQRLPHTLRDKLPWCITIVETALAQPTNAHWLDVYTMEPSRFAAEALAKFISNGFNWANPHNGLVSNGAVLGELLHFPLGHFLLRGMKLGVGTGNWSRTGTSTYTCVGARLVEFYLLLNVRRAMLASRWGILDIIQLRSLGHSTNAAVTGRDVSGGWRKSAEQPPLSNEERAAIKVLYESAREELFVAMADFFDGNVEGGANMLLQQLQSIHIRAQQNAGGPNQVRATFEMAGENRWEPYNQPNPFEPSGQIG